MILPPPRPTLFPYTTLFRSVTRVIVPAAARRHAVGYQKLRPRGAIDFPMLSVAFSARDRKSTRLNSSHQIISYAVFCLKKKNDHPHVPCLVDHLGRRAAGDE